MRVLLWQFSKNVAGSASAGFMEDIKRSMTANKQEATLLDIVN